MANSDNNKFVVSIDEQYSYLIDQGTWIRRYEILLEEALEQVQRDLCNPENWSPYQPGVSLVRVVKCDICDEHPCICEKREDATDQAIRDLVESMRTPTLEHDEEGVDLDQICPDCGESWHFGPCL